MNLILLEPDEISDIGDISLSGARGDHLRSVLKVTPGQQIRVGLVGGPSGMATVQSVADRSVEIRWTMTSDIPPRASVDLLLALPRPKVMRRLWAQLAALGVGQIILTNAERVERHYFDTRVLTPEIYRPLLIEGLQQARDTVLPEVSLHKRFKVLVEDDLDALFASGRRLLAHAESGRPVGAVVGESPGERILLAIGPEGGWNRFEIALLGSHGFQPVSMGPRTLRTDTACIALLGLVHASLR